MRKDPDKLELMSPAGDFTCLQAAIDNGADSIYFGVEQLNMRARASMNFTLDDLPEIAKRCKENGVRSYLTLNTIIYNHDLSIIKTLIDAAKAAEIDAVIAMDQAVINYAFAQKMEIHISTQLNVTNIETVKFYAHFVDTIVLSRELSLRQVHEICQQIVKEDVRGPQGRWIEVEIFGHGALCMAVSGKCYLSLHEHNSSANRGACKQECRRKYTVIDQETGNVLELDNEYIMSPKDLCTLDFLDDVIDAGVKVLKLEGRGRAPEYVATVTRVYRRAIDAYYAGTYTREQAKIWMEEELNTVYNRGFWGGYLLGQKLGEWNDSSGSKATQRKVYVGQGKHFYPKTNIAEFELEAFDIKIGDKVLIQGPTTGSQELLITQLMVNDASAESATKGEVFTLPVSFRVRSSDKMYKLVANDQP
jgi:putative protease